MDVVSIKQKCIQECASSGTMKLLSWHGPFGEILPTLIVPFLFPIDRMINRMMRDELVRECKRLCKDFESREEFLKIAEQVYGGPLETKFRAQVLMSYHKDPSNKDGFISNNQWAAERRGGRRPRRSRASSQETQLVTSTSE